MADAISIDFRLPFDEAIAAAFARIPTLPEIYYGEVPDGARRIAFSVSHLAGLDQITAVMDSLNAAHMAGLSLDQWREQALEQDWGLPDHRLDLIYRVHAQTAYNAGHWRNFQQNVDTRPYLMYSAINDSRTRPRHRRLSGYIAPVGDPFWRTHSPPLGFNCRCSLVSLTAKQAQARGFGTQEQPTVGADPGWQYEPLQAPEVDEKLLSDKAAASHPAINRHVVEALTNFLVFLRTKTRSI